MSSHDKSIYFETDKKVVSSCVIKFVCAMVFLSNQTTNKWDGKEIQFLSNLRDFKSKKTIIVALIDSAIIKLYVCNNLLII